jgi:hypothetical protein
VGTFVGDAGAQRGTISNDFTINASGPDASFFSVGMKGVQLGARLTCAVYWQDELATSHVNLAASGDPCRAEITRTGDVGAEVAGTFSATLSSALPDGGDAPKQVVSGTFDVLRFADVPGT